MADDLVIFSTVTEKFKGRIVSILSNKRTQYAEKSTKVKVFVQGGFAQSKNLEAAWQTIEQKTYPNAVGVSFLGMLPRTHTLRCQLAAKVGQIPQESCARTSAG